MAQNALHPARLTKIFVSIFLSVVVTSVTASVANATITLSAVENASNTGDLSETTPKIYGGVAGSETAGDAADPLTCAGKTGVATCNSCVNGGGNTDARFATCNTKRIYPTLQITFTFTSSESAGVPILMTDEDPGVKVDPVTEPGTVAKGATASVTYLWSDICAALDGGNGTCADGLDDTLVLGIDSDDNESLEETADDSTNIQVIVSDGGLAAVQDTCGTGAGICEFDIAPGDEKVKVQDLESESGFPTSGELDFKNVLFFLSTVSFDDISPASDYVPLAIEEDSDDSATFSLESEIVTGLVNEQRYWFKAAIQDIAMNVGLFTSDNVSEDGAHDCILGHAPPCHSGTPGDVVGILSEDVNCFVATAAFGSPMASQVSMLRQFRNMYLLTNKAGKKFVKWYYSVGPKAARFIAQSESLRLASRIALSPLVAFAWVAVNYGFLAALALLTLLFAIPIFYLRSLEFTSRHTSRFDE